MWVGPTSGLTIFFFLCYWAETGAQAQSGWVDKRPNLSFYFRLGRIETALTWAHMALTQPNDQVRNFAKCDSSHSARREAV